MKISGRKGTLKVVTILALDVVVVGCINVGFLQFKVYGTYIVKLNKTRVLRFAKLHTSSY